MNDFEFEQSPWEAFLDTASVGSVISAMTLLTLMEGETDDAVDDAFQIIGQKQLSLDLSQLPVLSVSGSSGFRLKQEIDFRKNGLDTAALSENDPLRLYLEELSMLPSYGDEDLLAAKTAVGDADAASKLAALGLSRAVELSIACTGHGVLLMDMIQEANLGLWQAIQSFKGGNYAVHRDAYIQNALAKAVFLQSRSNGLGHKMREALQDYKTADEKLLMELGRNPSLEEIADQIHISSEEASAIKKMMDDAILISRSQTPDATEEDSTDEDAAVEDTAYFQMRQRIEELLSHLSKEDARLLTLRFGLEKGRPLSPEDTARKMGITVSEVMSREASALAKLRN